MRWPGCRRNSRGWPDVGALRTAPPGAGETVARYGRSVANASESLRVARLARILDRVLLAHLALHDLERLAQRPDAFAERAHAHLLAPAARGGEVEHRDLVGEHAELRLQQSHERIERAADLHDEQAGVAALLGRQRQLLDQPVHALEPGRRLLQRLQLRQPRPVDATGR